MNFCFVYPLSVRHVFVFNCSFQYQGQSLNGVLLPGPTSGPSLPSAEQWPSMPITAPESDYSELRKSAFIGSVSTTVGPPLLDTSKFSAWRELTQTTVRSLHGAADSLTCQTNEAADYISAEKLILAQAPMDSFPKEIRALQSGRPLPNDI